MATRNRHFRTAILLVAASYLILTVKESIEAFHFLRDGVAVEADLGILIRASGHLVGIGGWAVVASAFGTRLDRSRLLLGAIIVGSVYAAFFIASVFELIPVLADSANADIRGSFRWYTIAAIGLAVGAAVVIAGLLEGRRGPDLAPRLQIGLAFAALGAGALTAALLYTQAYDSSRGYVHALPAGALVRAIGELGIALAALAVAQGARWPPARREARLAAAASAAALASLCSAVGFGILASADSTYGSHPWVIVTLWMEVASSLSLVVSYSYLASGARSVAGSAAVDPAATA